MASSGLVWEALEADSEAAAKEGGRVAEAETEEEEGVTAAKVQAAGSEAGSAAAGLVVRAAAADSVARAAVEGTRYTACSQTADTADTAAPAEGAAAAVGLVVRAAGLAVVAGLVGLAADCRTLQFPNRVACNLCMEVTAGLAVAVVEAAAKAAAAAVVVLAAAAAAAAELTGVLQG